VRLVTLTSSRPPPSPTLSRPPVSIQPFRHQPSLPLPRKTHRLIPRRMFRALRRRKHIEPEDLPPFPMGPERRPAVMAAELACKSIPSWMEPDSGISSWIRRRSVSGLVMTHSTSWRSSGGGWGGGESASTRRRSLAAWGTCARCAWNAPQHLAFPVHPFSTTSPDVTDAATGQRPRVHAAAGTIRRLSVLRVTPHPRRRRALVFTTDPVFFLLWTSSLDWD